MKWQTHTVTGSSHKSPCEWNERVFAGCENILRHAPLQTLLLINLSALCFESNLAQPPEKHSAVSGAWLCFEGRGLLPSQSTARLRCKNTSSQRSTLASGYTPHTPHTGRSSTGLKTSLTTAGLSLATKGLYSETQPRPFLDFVHKWEVLLLSLLIPDQDKSISSLFINKDNQGHRYPFTSLAWSD